MSVLLDRITEPKCAWFFRGQVDCFIWINPRGLFLGGVEILFNGLVGFACQCLLDRILEPRECGF